MTDASLSTPARSLPGEALLSASPAGCDAQYLHLGSTVHAWHADLTHVHKIVLQALSYSKDMDLVHDNLELCFSSSSLCQKHLEWPQQHWWPQQQQQQL